MHNIAEQLYFGISNGIRTAVLVSNIINIFYSLCFVHEKQSLITSSSIFKYCYSTVKVHTNNHKVVCVYADVSHKNEIIAISVS